MAQTTRPAPKVSIWAIEDRRRYGGAKPWNVRWRVGRRRSPFTQAFPTRTAADGYRSQLKVAHDSGERFDEVTGLPVSWTVSNLTVAEWAGKWFAEQAVTWAPRSRSNAADVLVRALPLLVPLAASAAPKDIRTEIRDWLSGASPMPVWLERWSVPLADLTGPTCRAAQANLGVRLDGRPAAASSINRFRKTMRAMLQAAVDDGHITQQPWPKAVRTRAATRIKVQKDITRLPTAEEARALIDGLVNHQPGSRGYRTLAALIYFAGLRPGEALALKASACNLPGSGWGSLRVRLAKRASSKHWTAEGEEFGDPKMGRFRTVPIPPELVAILREHIGERRTGFVVLTSQGTTVRLTNLDKAWRRQKAASGWTLYDLRHACATLWLSSGVPVGLVAERLGHSPDELLRTYTGVLGGDDDLANERISGALSNRRPTAADEVGAHV